MLHVSISWTLIIHDSPDVSLMGCTICHSRFTAYLMMSAQVLLHQQPISTVIVQKDNTGIVTWICGVPVQDKALMGARREAAQHLQRVREGDEAVSKLEAEARAMRDQVALAKTELDR